ncbi:vWA domain-containing protein [Thiosocius teredinicola]|uniref:vWA domain-containing protein n=1 Tax=Thiosocius teredinicola TaxID=1973002 RepID=UPI002FE4C3A6
MQLLKVAAIAAAIALTGCTASFEPSSSKTRMPAPSAPPPSVEQSIGLASPISAVLHGGPGQIVDRERYAEIESHGIKLVAKEPVSTFSIDVDTGSYSNVRRMLMEGHMPRKDAVRVEELINYFAYDDPAPRDRTKPFLVSTELAPTPWNRQTRLLRIALKAWELPEAQLPPSNLVFLVDVSGSMHASDKLPLLKRSIKLLTRQLRPQDRVSLVVYAGAAGVVLEPTPGDRQAVIENALDQLSAGGSTHGSAGIMLAYAKAREAFIERGVNRVILATDGDFNVGTVDHRALLDLIEREREAGVSLSVLGFGTGNLNDETMEQLADHGNGNYAYIDNLMEARKVLVEQVGGTLLTVAKDVKIQVEFNPARVAEYRLIGYENRALQREDFNNDRVDAGELGAGHSVVALYEIGLVGEGGSRVDPLRYDDQRRPSSPPSHVAELAFVKLRYKQPDADVSELLQYPVLERQSTTAASDDFRFSAAVAAFAQRLRGSAFIEDFDYADIQQLAGGARGQDVAGYRSDFLQLVKLAADLQPVKGAMVGQHSDDADR